MKRAYHLIWKIVRFLLIGICGCISFCITAYWIIYVISLKRYPHTYVISDVTLQRVIIDGDSLLSGKKLYLMKTGLREGTRTEIHPSIYYDAVDHFPNVSEDSLMNIFIETEYGICLNDCFSSIVPYGSGGSYDMLTLYGQDTIWSVLWDNDIKIHERFLRGEEIYHFIEPENCCLFSLNETDSVPHKIRFVFPDRVIEKTVNNTLKHYTVRYR